MGHRKIYKEVWGKIPKGWHIHHIDIDDSNNDPDNLVAIPQSFHQKYHFARNFVKGEMAVMVRNLYSENLEEYKERIKDITP